MELNKELLKIKQVLKMYWKALNNGNTSKKLYW